jgi:hypothetical protein
MDKNVIRRIIRRHINEVRFCYEQELARKPDLGGRVQLQFTIAGSGQVVASALENSTIRNTQVENCIVAAVRRWEFPRPLDGGNVIVSHLFVLTPASMAEVASVPPVSDHSLVDALGILAGRGEVGDRVERIASLLGLDRTLDPESLAWMIDRHDASLDEVILVARLLVAGKAAHDAIRVLSERAYVERARIAAEFRRMAASADAAEVVVLARRAP